MGALARPEPERDDTTSSLHLRRILVRRLLIVSMNHPILLRIERPVVGVHVLGRHGEHETVVIGTEAGRVISALGAVRHALCKSACARQGLQRFREFAMALLVFMLRPE